LLIARTGQTAEVVADCTPRAVGAKTAQPKARKSFWQSLKEFAQQGADEHEAEAANEGAEPMATLESTELDNGAFLYRDGALAVDTAVFNDEALTEVTADGDYGTKDSQVITVAAGIVTAIGAAEAVATAKLTQRFDQMEATLKAEQAKSARLETEVAALKKLKPAMPQARNSRPNADAPDPKEPAAPKATAAHHKEL
jgi:hypothetical protein